MKDTFIFLVLSRVFVPHLMLALVWTLKIAALLLLAFGFASLLRRRSARARCWIWRLLFAALVLLLALELGPRKISQLRPAISVEADKETSEAAYKTAQAFQVIRPHEELTAIYNGAPSKPDAEPLPPWESRNPRAIFKDYTTERLQRVEAVIPWLWGAGVGLGLLWLALRTIAVRALLRRRATLPSPQMLAAVASACETLRVRRKPVVRLSAQVDTPLLFGFVRPLIYLPTAAAHWEHTKLVDVYLHELAHWKRADYTWRQFGRMVTTLFWWFPPLRYGLRAMIQSAEEAADDMVLLSHRPADRYAQTLVEIAAGVARKPPYSGVAMLGCRSLEQRIQHLMRESHWRGRLGIFAISAIVTATLSVGAVASITFSSPAVLQVSEVKHPPLSKADRTLAKQIVEANKRRLSLLRIVHINATWNWVEESGGRRIASPEPSQLELFWDVWSGNYKMSYRPKVTRWLNGTANFFISNYLEIRKGDRVYSGNDSESLREIDATPREFYPDLLNTSNTIYLIDILTQLIEGGSTEWEGVQYTLRTVEQDGTPLIEFAGRFSKDGKVNQELLMFLSPEDYLIVCTRRSFPLSTMTKPIERRAIAFETAANGERYVSEQEYTREADDVWYQDRYTILSLEPLKRLPEMFRDPANDVGQRGFK